MLFTKIQTYDVIEESIVNGQKLCDFETDITSPQYSITSSYNQYFSVIDNNVYLTGDGKEAINKDYPDDITKEIHHLNFTIIAKNAETDETITQDVSIKVNRIIDNEPHVLNHFEHNLYVENLYVNMMVSKIDLVYNTFCNIVGTDSSFFEIDPIPDIGTDNITVKLNANGVSKYNNLDFSTLDASDISTVNGKKLYKHKITLEFIDATNNKSITFDIYVKFFEGSEYQNLPTKNNLEIQAEKLGTKIASIITDSNDKINSNNFYISLVKKQVRIIGNRLNMASSNIEEINSNLEESIKENLENTTFINDKIDSVIKSNEDIYEIIYSEIEKFLEQSKASDLKNKAESFYKANNNELFALSSDIYSKKFVEFLLARTDKEISTRFDKFTSALKTYFTDYTTAIKSNIIDSTTSKFNKIVGSINELVPKVASNYGLAQKGIAYAGKIDTQIGSLDTRLSGVEVRTLENWGTDSKWKFSGNLLKYNYSTVISYGSSNTTINGVSSVTLNANSSTMKWDGDLTMASDTTVTAGTFTGTANKAKYADLAEFYKKELHDNYNYIPGTIVYINASKPEANFEITENYKNNIFCGVLTTNPGFILNTLEENNPEYACIALTGRVPVRCIGNIKKGMYMYPSCINPNLAEGTYNLRNTPDLIGIALENSSDNIDTNTEQLILTKVK